MPPLGPIIYGQKIIRIPHFVFVNTTICVCNSKVQISVVKALGF